jgi:hypothetical protein
MNFFELREIKTIDHMKTSLFPSMFILLICMALIGAAPAENGDTSSQGRTASLHAGFLYPNGVDLAGYTVEHELKHGFYYYYTFGFPSLAATGISYYSGYNDDGLAATAGVGIGSVLYASLVYQLHILHEHFIKLGAGYTTGIAYTGVYPALSYEFRFK